MWSGWSVGCYGLYILEGGSSELVGQVDPVGPAVICALGWLGLVEVGAGLLAFIQLMWVTHPPHSRPLWDKISPRFSQPCSEGHLTRKVRKPDDFVDANAKDKPG